jgi:hypothetical protein
VIQFLWSGAAENGEIDEIMTVQYGDNCMRQNKI